MAAISGGFSSLMAPGLRKVIFQEYAEADQVHPLLFNVNPSARQYEDDRQISGLGTVPTKEEGVAITYSDPLESFTKRYTHASYGMGIRITREMYDDDLYGVAKRWAGALGRSAMATVETLAGNIFNNGFADTGPDGVSMFNTAHVLKGSVTTVANKPTTDADLTVASLEAAITNFRQQKDDMGLWVTGKPQFLLVSPSDEFTAQKLVQSTLQPFTADNQKNIIATRNLTVVVWDYLTDSDAWFLLGPKGQTQLNFFWRIRPVVGNEDDFDTLDAKFRIYFRCAVGYSDWRMLYGTSGA